MPENYTQEYEALASAFDARWRTVPNGATYRTPIAWPNIVFTPPDPPSNWVSFDVLTGDSLQASTGAPGQNTFRHNGVISINIYVPDGAGKTAALDFADKASAIFRKQRNDGIFLRAPSVNDLGEGGGYYRVNVSVGFFRDTAL